MKLPVLIDPDKIQRTGNELFGFSIKKICFNSTIWEHIVRITYSKILIVQIIRGDK